MFTRRHICITMATILTIFLIGIGSYSSYAQTKDEDHSHHSQNDGTPEAKMNMSMDEMMGHIDQLVKKSAKMMTGMQKNSSMTEVMEGLDLMSKCIQKAMWNMHKLLDNQKLIENPNSKQQIDDMHEHLHTIMLEFEGMLENMENLHQAVKK